MTAAHRSTELMPLAEAEVASTPEAASEARRFLISKLGPGMPGEDIALVAAELLSNAVHHGVGATFHVRLDAGAHVVRITVTNYVGPRPRSTHLSAELATSGRGLLLVAALACGWASSLVPDGRRRTWADLPKRRTS